MPTLILVIVGVVAVVVTVAGVVIVVVGWRRRRIIQSLLQEAVLLLQQAAHLLQRLVDGVIGVGCGCRGRWRSWEGCRLRLGEKPGLKSLSPLGLDSRSRDLGIAYAARGRAVLQQW